MELICCQFDPTESSVRDEAKSSLALLSRMDSDYKKTRREHEPSVGEGVLNVRKAVRFASKGRGNIALGREVSKGGQKSKRGKSKR